MNSIKTSLKVPETNCFLVYLMMRRQLRSISIARVCPGMSGSGLALQHLLARQNVERQARLVVREFRL